MLSVFIWSLLTLFLIRAPQMILENPRICPKCVIHWLGLVHWPIHFPKFLDKFETRPEVVQCYFLECFTSCWICFYFLPKNRKRSPNLCIDTVANPARRKLAPTSAIFTYFLKNHNFHDFDPPTTALDTTLYRKRMSFLNKLSFCFCFSSVSTPKLVNIIHTSKPLKDDHGYSSDNTENAVRFQAKSDAQAEP